MKNRGMRFMALVGLLFMMSIGHAQKGSTNIDFKIKNFGVYVHGSFSEITISSNFDQNNLDDSYIKATVFINSINTNNTKRDKHLLEADYFDEPNYGKLTFSSTNIEKTTTNNYKITGRLTIKGTTKSIVIPAVIDQNDRTINIDARFELNRKDYDVGGNSWVLSNTVKIDVLHTIIK